MDSNHFISRPSNLRLFLDELKTLPKKSLSQNFLIDGNILQKIVKTADVQPGDLVLEIGPGPGALTEILLQKGAHVVAVEKDRIFAEALKRLQTEDNRLEVFNDDILEFPLDKHLHRKTKVISNLPYHLTTPILALLFPRRDLFSTLTVMVQEEVARRFVAPPGGEDYSSFTVFLSYYSKAKYAFKVGRNCFYPAPRVDSAIVTMELKEPPSVSDEEGFFKLTRGAFSQRRKMLRASLKEQYSPALVEKALTDMGVNPLSRPEELSLDQFLQLFSALNPQV